MKGADFPVLEILNPRELPHAETAKSGRSPHHSGGLEPWVAGGDYNIAEIHLADAIETLTSRGKAKMKAKPTKQEEG